MRELSHGPDGSVTSVNYRDLPATIIQLELMSVHNRKIGYSTIV